MACLGFNDIVWLLNSEILGVSDVTLPDLGPAQVPGFSHSLLYAPCTQSPGAALASPATVFGPTHLPSTGLQPLLLILPEMLSLLSQFTSAHPPSDVHSRLSLITQTRSHPAVTHLQHCFLRSTYVQIITESLLFFLSHHYITSTYHHTWYIRHIQ